MSVRVVPMSEEQHKSAKKRWGLVKAEVKLGMFGKAMQHKKKIAAAVTVKIIIIVVIVVIATTVVAAVAAYKTKTNFARTATPGFAQSQSQWPTRKPQKLSLSGGYLSYHQKRMRALPGDV